ncbi:MAG: HD domain-containing protein [Bacteroidales bacterium]|nr:HD domain-containing protein [Bacteroidales bacterium]
MDKTKRKTSFLKHIAELISKNKMLVTENEKLTKQNEQLLQEIEKYKLLLAKDEIQKKFSANEKVSRIVKYKISTVLYAEAQGFSDIGEDMDTKFLVDNLDEIFLQLNTIIGKYEIKNLKTIGDTIMCVGGIPKKNITNPLEVVLAAVEMQYYIKDLQRSYKDSKIWKLKIGIHTGPLVASVTGRKKPHYEVKGDTVNLAARIKSFCSDGEILISATTYEIVKDLFNCEYYGKMPVKYKGDIQLYTVRGIKPDFSLQSKGLIPNKKYSIRFGLTQFMDLQEMILDKLEKELPKTLYYHNVKHTVDVVTQAELIGFGEGVSDEELLLLKTAALFHDTGHTIGYDNHEYNSTIIAREILPNYYYTQSQIDIICDLIMATKLPPNPKNKLEQIMCDADLDYLGRSDMIPVSNSLFMELKEQNKISSLNDWNKLQVKFISGHQYYTYTARNLREVNKQNQIERISNLIEV